MLGRKKGDILIKIGCILGNYIQEQTSELRLFDTRTSVAPRRHLVLVGILRE